MKGRTSSALLFGVGFSAAVLLALFVVSAPRTSFAQGTTPTGAAKGSYLAAQQEGTTNARQDAAIRAGLDPNFAKTLNWADPKYADLQCVPVKHECGCGLVLVKTAFGGSKCVGGANKWKCSCSDARTPRGQCSDNFTCTVDTYTALNGKSAGVDGGLSQLGQSLGKLMQQLMSGSMGGATGGGSGSSPYTVGSTCTTYYTVTTPSSDPCAIYQPPTSNLIDTTTGTDTGSNGDLLSQLLGDTGNSNQTPVSNLLNLVTDTTPSTSVLNVVSSGTSTASSSITSASTGLPAGLTPSAGQSGDILLSNGGATVVVNDVNAQTNSAVAGFYGESTFGSQQPQGLAAQLCENRPWANSFISAVIPSSFFDGICTWRGYQVGTQVSAPVLQQTVVTTTPAATSTKPVATSTSPLLPAKVQIWASPTSVPLATRTSIFWTTQGVTDCKETSPDGSFNQSTLSGGASTVPLSGPTTFTISCLDSQGNPVTDSVTVNLSI